MIIKSFLKALEHYKLKVLRKLALISPITPTPLDIDFYFKSPKKAGNNLWLELLLKMHCKQ